MRYSSPGRSGLLRGLLAFVLWGCLTAAAAPMPVHGDAPGIEWFSGDVAAAFEAARSGNKPVFLYWGAKWCPPCQQLKSSVFSRSDFIAKSRQFVAVYLDGDEPGAQKWGERFHVSGYPTVVILRADQQEITRISGGMDLSVYADLLDSALSDAKPMTEVLAAVRNGGRNPPSHADCQRLAYYAWDLADVAQASRPLLAADLGKAATTCTSASVLERARLQVAAVQVNLTPEGVDAVLDIVGDPVRAAGVADALESLDPTFFKTVRERGPAVVAGFVAAWTRTMDRVATNPSVIEADQLSAVSAKLAALKFFAADGRVPLEAANAARARLTAALARHYDPYVRAGVVNAASSIDEVLGDDDAEYAMLKAELATSATPFYYMADLGEAEEKHGHTAEALGWYARAYTGSSGVATRFQWGTLYLSALLRLVPDDHARIRKVGLEVIAELDGPDRIHARTLANLAKLDSRLHAWNAHHAHDIDIRVLQARMAGVCTRQPRSGSGRDGCRHFLT